MQTVRRDPFGLKLRSERDGHENISRLGLAVCDFGIVFLSVLSIASVCLTSTLFIKFLWKDFD